MFTRRRLSWGCAGLSMLLLSSCNSVDREFTRFIEGCRDKGEFLRSQSLQRVTGDPIRLGPIEFDAPQDYYARIDSDQVSLFRAIYCDSGYWGVGKINQVRVKLYDGTAPESLYADLPAEQISSMERMAPPIGELEHNVLFGNYRWKVRTQLSGNVVPMLRTAYLTTSLDNETVAVSFFTRNSSQGDNSALTTVVGSIRKRSSVRSGNDKSPSQP